MAISGPAQITTTKPKPFVFVLMPFDPAFSDVYKFGIKGAAEEAGAYAERVDEQTFVEGMLDRIFNQINKADVIVADMTGKNPNVFYEVGYAHALDKIVLLLTQKTDDIPFDLKHRQHTVYGGSIEKLKNELVQRIRWAVEEATRRAVGLPIERISVRLEGADLVRGGAIESAPEIGGIIKADTFTLDLIVRNESVSPIDVISHVYLFSAEDASAVPATMRDVQVWPSVSSQYVTKDLFSSGSLIAPLQLPSTVRRPEEIDSFKAAKADSLDGLSTQYRLPVLFDTVPPGAIESVGLLFLAKGNQATGAYRLRIHGENSFHDFYFRMNIQKETPPSPPEKGAGK